MDYGTIFIYLGMIACLCSSAYLYYCGKKKVAILFIIGFLLEFQGTLYLQFIDSPESSGDCWATKESFYDCLPLMSKLSMHASQIGVFVLAAAILYLAVESKKQ
jgi:hypothetical protein